MTADLDAVAEREYADAAAPVAGIAGAASKRWDKSNFPGTGITEIPVTAIKVARENNELSDGFGIDNEDDSARGMMRREASTVCKVPGGSLRTSPVNNAARLPSLAISQATRNRFEHIKANGGTPRYYKNKHGSISVMDVSRINAGRQSERQRAKEEARRKEIERDQRLSRYAAWFKELRALTGANTNAEAVRAIRNAFNSFDERANDDAPDLTREAASPGASEMAGSAS